MRSRLSITSQIRGLFEKGMRGRCTKRTVTARGRTEKNNYDEKNCSVSYRGSARPGIRVFWGKRKWQQNWLIKKQRGTGKL